MKARFNDTIIAEAGVVSADAAFSYPSLLPGSLEIVKKDYVNYVAFWRDVEVSE